VSQLELDLRAGTTQRHISFIESGRSLPGRDIHDHPARRVAPAPTARPLVPPRPALGPDHLGFAVPLRLASEYGELRLISTLTRFGTAIDVAVSELRMEAFLPADEPTAKALRLLDPAASG
jgi:hypothetical protein